MEKWVAEKSELIYNPNYQSEIENNHFCQYKKSIICNLTFSLSKNSHIEKEVERLVNEEAVGNFIADLAKKFNTDFEDAKFAFDGARVSAFSLGKPGAKLDEEKSKVILVNYLNSNSKDASIDLPFTTMEPNISADSIDSMGITTLIGEGQSNFAGSPRNRIHNINVGAKRFNGVLIKPGEIFSFIKILGPVDESTGYLPELVIRPNETVPEFGGGMCQVSTTAFRAALKSGLEIIERTNHAYPVSYYNPQGMDATVYIPKPDLRFKNNTPGYILIQTKIVGTQLYFDFYGTNDGRSVELQGPTVLEKNPDGSMKTTLTQIVKDKNGNVTLSDTFKSNYDSPNKYPHPGQEPIFTSKPDKWSEHEWKIYKKAHGM